MAYMFHPLNGREGFDGAAVTRTTPMHAKVTLTTALKTVVLARHQELGDINRLKGEFGLNDEQLSQVFEPRPASFHELANAK